MIKKVIKYIVSYNNYLNLRFNKVIYASNLRVRGLLSISNYGTIIIGSGVKINSRYSANPVGQGVCTGLFTFPKGKIVIGDYVGMSNALLYSRESIVIEDKVFLGGGVQLLDNDFHSLHYEKRILRPDPDVKSGSIRICKGAFIGANSIILKGVTVGSKSIIGAGSVVTKSVPPGQIWAGNPARFVKSIEDLK